jgi:hypothetical protein
VRRWLILPLLALAVLPVRWRAGESRASLLPSPHLRVRTRVAARAGNKAAPLELVEQMLDLEISRGLDGALAAEWLTIGRLFGHLGHREAAQIVFRWVECRAREGAWRARAAHEVLKLLARTTNTVTSEDWVALGLAHALPEELIEQIAVRCATKGGALSRASLLRAVEQRRTGDHGWNPPRLRRDLRALLGD